MIPINTLTEYSRSINHINHYILNYENLKSLKIMMVQ